jgi:hypothetical protein
MTAYNTVKVIAVSDRSHACGMIQTQGAINMAYLCEINKFKVLQKKYLDFKPRKVLKKEEKKRRKKWNCAITKG